MLGSSPCGEPRIRIGRRSDCWTSLVCCVSCFVYFSLHGALLSDSCLGVLQTLWSSGVNARGDVIRISSELLSYLSAADSVNAYCVNWLKGKHFSCNLVLCPVLASTRKELTDRTTVLSFSSCLYILTSVLKLLIIFSHLTFLLFLLRMFRIYCLGLSWYLGICHDSDHTAVPLK